MPASFAEAAKRDLDALAMVKGPTAEDNAAFDAMWTTLEGARIARERGKRPQPEDKCKPIFKKGREGYQQFYVDPARGYNWQCWCISEYVNAAGYFLMWKRGRRREGGGGSTLVESDIQAAKDRSVLMRRVEKYQQASWAREQKDASRRAAKQLLEAEALRKRKRALPAKHKS